jgi:hypothetical protein
MNTRINIWNTNLGPTLIASICSCAFASAGCPGFDTGWHAYPVRHRSSKPPFLARMEATGRS